MIIETPFAFSVRTPEYLAFEATDRGHRSPQISMHFCPAHRYTNTEWKNDRPGPVSSTR